MANRAIDVWHPTNLTEYVEVVEEIQTPSSVPIWYRGCSLRGAQLLPSLYRPRANPSVGPSELSALEEQLVTRFRDRSLPYHSRALTDELETLFFMQHYAIPTRLLDWTENPFVGLAFSLRHAPHVRDSRGILRFREDAVVWILDPTRWNRAALAHVSFMGGPLDPGHAQLASYKPIGAVEKLGAMPVALYGAHNSQRIVAQQGTFVIFGSRTTPMEELYRHGDDFEDGCLGKVVIRRGLIDTFRNSLFSLGFTEGLLFPDLDGLGRDLRRSLGFDI